MPALFSGKDEVALIAIAVADHDADPFGAEGKKEAQAAPTFGFGPSPDCYADTTSDTSCGRAGTHKKGQTVRPALE